MNEDKRTNNQYPIIQVDLIKLSNYNIKVVLMDFLTNMTVVGIVLIIESANIEGYDTLIKRYVVFVNYLYDIELTEIFGRYKIVLKCSNPNNSIDPYDLENI